MYIYYISIVYLLYLEQYNIRLYSDLKIKYNIQFEGMFIWLNKRNIEIFKFCLVYKVCCGCGFLYLVDC